MTGYSWDNNGDDEETPLVRRLRQEIENRDKRLSDLDKTVNELQGKVRSQSVADVLREIGAKPGLAKFVPSGVETTRDAIGAWLKDNEELFGPVAPKTDESKVDEVEPQAPANPLAPAATPAQVEAFQRMSNSDNNTSTLPDIETSQQAQLAAMAQAAGGDVDKYLSYLRGDIKLT